MPLMIDNLKIAKAAPVQTTVGTFTLLSETGSPLGANYMLDEDSAGFFAIAGYRLVNIVSPIPAGNYAVKVRVTAQRLRYTDKACFVVTVA